jgi:hypothetical protein
LLLDIRGILSGKLGVDRFGADALLSMATLAQCGFFLACGWVARTHPCPDVLLGIAREPRCGTAQQKSQSGIDADSSKGHGYSLNVDSGQTK